MLYLVADTETGGLSPDTEDLLEAAFILADPQFNEVWSYRFLLSKLNYRSSPEALTINGINLDHCREYGLPAPNVPAMNDHQRKSLDDASNMLESLRQLQKDHES